MAAEGFHGNRGLVPRARASDFRLLLLSPRRTPSQWAMREGGGAVDVIHPRCAGLDISQKDAKVCVRINGAGRRKTSETVTTFGATTRQIMAMRDMLAEQQVTCVVMEATGDYWKPFYYLLTEAGLPVMLANARQVRQIPGRKT